MEADVHLAEGRLQTANRMNVARRSARYVCNLFLSIHYCKQVLIIDTLFLFLGVEVKVDRTVVQRPLRWVN